ncbi:MAG: exodeoxyribonuclease VII large subunit [Thermoleophilia bacterium]|nr:exodeoxyribonuclease VII large subunit [Thermoleophilia bacterium]
MKIEPLLYGDRKVYRVSGFNRGVDYWLRKLGARWVEGEVTELRRQDTWRSTYFTLKDPEDGSSLPAHMPRDAFDALGLELADGALVHVHGQVELWAKRGELRFRADAIEPVGLGEVLLRLERLKRQLAAEGLFDVERKRPLPYLPTLIGLVTGSDAAARRDVLATIRGRFPPARILVAETIVTGPRAPLAITSALNAVCEAGADVIVLARGGGSFDDLLAFSDERLVRAVAACPVPVVSAVGHERDVPLCDLAADARASTPTAAARLVVPDWAELLEQLAVLRGAVGTAARRRVERAASELARDRLRLVRAPALLLERKRSALAADRARLERAPALLVERARGRLDVAAGRLRALSPQATLARGYAVVRRRGAVVRAAAELSAGERVDVQVASGGFGAVVESVRP